MARALTTSDGSLALGVDGIASPTILLTTREAGHFARLSNGQPLSNGSSARATARKTKK